MQQKARDQAYIRQSNILAVLKVIQDARPVSRRDLIGLTGMSPTSITRIVGALLEQSLLVEGALDGDAAGRGRKAILLHINPDGLYTLGFFVTRDRIMLHVHDFGDATLHMACRALEDRERTAEEIAEEAHALFRSIPSAVMKHPSHLRGIGVSVSGIINQRLGIVEESTDMRWRDVDVRAAFEARFGLPTWVENDVKAALIGEKDRLDIPRQTDAAYLYLGDHGISTAQTSGGELVRGVRNAAGEVAHIVLTPGDLPCTCGKHGCLQLHLVETYLIQRARRIDPSVQSMEGILAAYAQRMAWAEVLIGDFKRHLRMLIDLLDGLCNPERIIVLGSVVTSVRALLADILADDHVIIADDFEGASLRGVSIIAMQQTLRRRLLEEAPSAR